MAAIDALITEQPEPRPTRAKALRRFAAIGALPSIFED